MRPTQPPRAAAKRQVSAGRIKDFCLRFAASFLILWTPFFFFSAFRGHPVPAGSLVYSALSFAVAALLYALALGRGRGLRRVLLFALIVCLFLNLQFSWFAGIVALGGAFVIAGVFWLLRQHLALILTVVFATVLVSSVVITPAEQYVDHRMVENADAGSAAAEGLYLHLILDEFAGIAGIPASSDAGRALRADLEDFFLANGFVVHRAAISQYIASRSSISGLLNFEATSRPERNFRGKRPYVLTNNAYFTELRKRGYRLRVTQSTYMDFCTESPVALAACATYRHDGTDWLKDAALSDRRKFAVLLGMYFNLPGFFEKLWKTYVSLRGAAARAGLAAPALMAWDGGVAPMASMAAFERLREELRQTAPGTAYFAHFLLPHGPYVYDPACRLRGRPFGWLNHRPLHRKNNSQAGRERRYRLYFDQVRCTQARLRALFEDLEAAGWWESATIVIHGDHGSRLYETAPRAGNRERLTPQDLADGYYTLFAVKAPSLPPGAEEPTRPITRLLAAFIGAEASGGGDTVPTVYLEARDDQPWAPLGWPKMP